MKKYLGFVIVAGLLLSFSFALANDNSPSTNSGSQNSGPGSVRARIEANQSSFRAGLQGDRAAFLADLKVRMGDFAKANADKRKQFWNNAKEMIAVRFAAAVGTLENVQVRVGTAIDTLHADGKDTDAASDYLDSSKQELADAKVKLADIKALLPDDGSQITVDTFQKIKVDARDAKDLLKESRNDLLLAIKEIKDLKGDDRDNNDKDKSN